MARPSRVTWPGNGRGPCMYEMQGPRLGRSSTTRLLPWRAWAAGASNGPMLWLVHHRSRTPAHGPGCPVRSPTPVPSPEGALRGCPQRSLRSRPPRSPWPQPRRRRLRTHQSPDFSRNRRVTVNTEVSLAFRSAFPRLSEPSPQVSGFPQDPRSRLRVVPVFAGREVLQARRPPHKRIRRTLSRFFGGPQPVHCQPLVVHRATVFSPATSTGILA